MFITDRLYKHMWRFTMLSALLVHVERSGIRTRRIPGSSIFSEAKYF
jgi:hypothetical protein